MPALALMSLSLCAGPVKSALTEERLSILGMSSPLLSSVVPVTVR